MDVDVTLFDNFTKKAVVTLTCIIVAGCSSNSDRGDIKQAEQNRAVVSQAQKERAAKARALSQLSPAEQQIAAAYEALNAGATKLELESLLTGVSEQNFHSIDSDLALAKIYLHLQQAEKAQVIIDRLKQGALPTKQQIPLWLASAQLDALNKEYLSSIRTLFRLSQLYGQHLSASDKRMNNELIWQNLLQLDADALAPFSSDFGEEVDSWIQLAKLLQRFEYNPNRFSQQISNWSNNHALYSQVEFLPEQIAELSNVTPISAQNIALVLPYTGKLAKQSEAIRNGFLAAVDFNSDVRYTLLDSQSLSIEQIEQKVVENNIDFIVGPLQKETVTAMAQSEILSQIPQLNLNTPEPVVGEVEEAATASLNNRYFFALDPEEEIAQAVNYFVEKGVEYPAVIYADISFGRRLFEQFNTLWQEQTGKELESIAFQNTSKLGVAVKELLDVGLSEKRIKQIERLFGSKIKSEERSRTDIDAIYVIANSQQTRLIKPFFDVNVSQFGNSLPIYASSRSYLIGETQSEKLDLNGLTFTEIPWLVSDYGKSVDELYGKVGENNTQLKKFFAFGYDAQYLINMLPYLAVLPEKSVAALNGDLHMDKDQVVKRELMWAQYKQGQVLLVNKLNR